MRQQLQATRMMVLGPVLVLGGLATAGAQEQRGTAAARFEAQEIRRDFAVGYAVSIADMNGDGRDDIVAINGTQLVWFENPSWTERVAIDGQTPKDNVAIAPYDIDGDGRMDVALGAGWNPRDTKGGGTLHWAGQGAAAFTLHDIGSEPTLHRIRWGNVDGKGKQELIVGPLHGRGTSPPEWNEAGSRLLAFSVPAKPASDPWPVEVVFDGFHILHNFEVVRFFGTERDDIITASREGVNAFQRNAKGSWQRTKIGEGAPGEIKLGNVNGRRVIATVEPWHGNSVVLFVEPEGGAAGALWQRSVIEEQIAGGHALAWADFNGDGRQQLAVGWRDGTGGVAIYDVDRNGRLVQKTMVDDGGMATEDLVAADLNGDGRPEIVASGRRTSNVKIYWNRSAATSGK